MRTKIFRGSAAGPLSEATDCQPAIFRRRETPHIGLASLRSDGQERPDFGTYLAPGNDEAPLRRADLSSGAAPRGRW